MIEPDQLIATAGEALHELARRYCGEFISLYTNSDGTWYIFLYCPDNGAALLAAGAKDMEWIEGRRRIGLTIEKVTLYTFCSLEDADAARR